MKFVINSIHLIQVPPDCSHYYTLQDYCFQFEILKMKARKFRNKIPPPVSMAGYFDEKRKSDYLTPTTGCMSSLSPFSVLI